MSNSGSGNDDVFDARVAKVQALRAAVEILERNEEMAGWLFDNMGLKGALRDMAVANFMTFIADTEREMDALVKITAHESLDQM